MCLFQEIYETYDGQYSLHTVTQHYATDPLNLDLTSGETTELASYEAQNPEIDGLISSSSSASFSIMASSPSPVPRNSIRLPPNVADDPGTISPSSGRFVPLSPASHEAYFRFKLFKFPAPVDGRRDEDHASGTIGTGAWEDDDTISYTKYIAHIFITSYMLSADTVHPRRGFHKAHASDFPGPFLHDSFESQKASQVDAEDTPISGTGRLPIWSGLIQKRKKLAESWIISCSDDDHDFDPVQDSPSLSRILNRRANHYGR